MTINPFIASILARKNHKNRCDYTIDKAEKSRTHYDVGALGKSMPISTNRIKAVLVLRKAARGCPIDADVAWREIEAVMEVAARKEGSGDTTTSQIDACIYALALIYARHTNSRPAFTNGDTGTKFEHFIQAISMPTHFGITPHRIKASIRKMDPPRNPDFSVYSSPSIS